MRKYYIFPASSSNQITESYYFSLIGQINRGTCSKKVSKILRRSGNHTYFTYHLISTK
jgi:hypothetical protein